MAVSTGLYLDAPDGRWPILATRELGSTTPALTLGAFEPAADHVEKKEPRPSLFARLIRRVRKLIEDDAVSETIEDDRRRAKLAPKKRLHTLLVCNEVAGFVEVFDMVTGASLSHQYAITDVKVLCEGGVHRAGRLQITMDCPSYFVGPQQAPAPAPNNELTPYHPEMEEWRKRGFKYPFPAFLMEQY